MKQKQLKVELLNESETEDGYIYHFIDLIEIYHKDENFTIYEMLAPNKIGVLYNDEAVSTNNPTIDDLPNYIREVLLKEIM